MTPNTVLVIENESATIGMVEQSLQNEGYTIYSAVDAESGLQMARETLPSLIMLNLAVDGANGLEICKTIHSDASLKDVPLVLLTLREGKFDPIYTKLYGIVNFLKKPFTPEQLVENVREFAPFQAGAKAPATRQAASPAAPVVEEEEEEAFSFLSETSESEEQEPEYDMLDEPVEPPPTFGDVDEPMGEMSEDEMDDDVYSIDEDVSLDDETMSFETDDIQNDEGLSAESFQQDVQMVPEDESPVADEDDFQMLEENTFQEPESDDFEMPEEDDFQMLGDAEISGAEAGTEPLDDAFDLPEDDESLPPLHSTAAEDEMEDGPGLTLDGMGFDTPDESGESMDFEMPEEEEKPAPRKRTRAAAPQTRTRGKSLIELRNKPASSINKPKGSRTTVLLLVLLVVLALAAGASYYFFLYEPGTPAQMAKAPAPKPAPQEPVAAPAPPEPAPSAAQGDIPPPAGVKPAPAPVKPPKAEIPAPAVPAPAPAQAVTPKPAVPAPKPPPPRPPAPTQTAQTESPLAAGAKYTVQFGVFSTERNAQSLIDRLKAKGLSTFIKPRKTSSGKFLYYVLLEGGFKTKDSASRKADEIKRSKGVDTTVHAL